MLHVFSESANGKIETSIICMDGYHITYCIIMSFPIAGIQQDLFFTGWSAATRYSNGVDLVILRDAMYSQGCTIFIKILTRIKRISAFNIIDLLNILHRRYFAFRNFTVMDIEIC